MLKEIITNDWVQALALLLTIATGIWFFWEKIRIGTRWIRKRVKNWFVSFKAIPQNPFHDQGRITDTNRFFGRKDLLRILFEELKKARICR